MSVFLVKRLFGRFLLSLWHDVPLFLISDRKANFILNDYHSNRLRLAQIFIFYKCPSFYISLLLLITLTPGYPKDAALKEKQTTLRKDHCENESPQCKEYSFRGRMKQQRRPASSCQTPHVVSSETFSVVFNGFQNITRLPQRSSFHNVYVHSIITLHMVNTLKFHLSIIPQ